MPKSNLSFPLKPVAVAGWIRQRVQERQLLTKTYEPSLEEICVVFGVTELLVGHAQVEKCVR